MNLSAHNTQFEILPSSSTASSHLLDQVLASDSDLTGYLTQLTNSESKATGGARVQSFDAGDLIATPDELSHNMYILLSGTVDLVVTNAKNQRMIAGSLGPGAIFGDGALTDADPTNLFVHGESSGKVVCVAAGHANRMVEKHPILAWALLQTYGERQSQIEQYLEDVAYKTLPERLSRVLLEYTDMEDGDIVGLSHQNLADRLGTYRETISAILRTFKEEGLVELGYRRITIVDTEGLMDLAGIWEW